MSNIELELYNNINTPVALLNNSWVKDGIITYNYMDIDTFELVIPLKLTNNIINPIFKQIRSGQQIILSKDGIKKDRFYITSEKITRGKKSFNNKTFTCYQFQKKLEGLIINIPEGTYQLKSGIDKKYEDEGLFDLIEKNCGYSIILDNNSVAYIKENLDEKIDYSLALGIYNDFKIGDVLFDVKVDFKVKKVPNGTIPIYLNIMYDNIIVEDELNDKVEYGTIYNDFDTPFYNDISRIKCEYYDAPGNRNTLKYTFYYVDGTTEEEIKSFVNAKNKKLIVNGDNVISHTTGNITEQEVMKFVSYDETEINIRDLLNDISDKYDVVYEFDNINMVIHVYSKKDYGNLKPLELSLESNCLEVTTSEVEDNLLATSILVKGNTIDGKEITIRNKNPFGGDIIYCYDYYINNGLLSDKTIEEWNNYLVRLEELQIEWDNLITRSREIDEVLISVEAEIISLNKKISYWSELLSSYITSKSPNLEAQKRVSSELVEFKDRLKELLKKQSQLREEKDNMDSIMLNWSINNNRENIKDKQGNKIFSKESLKELNDIEKTIEYTDDYFTTETSLYNYYNDKLKEIVYPKIEFTIKGANIKKYLDIYENIFELGMKHELDEELKDLFETNEVRLTSMKYNINYGDYTEFSFSNSYKQSELFAKLISLKRSNVKTSKKLANYSEVKNNVVYSKKMLDSFKMEGIDTENTPIVSKNDNSIIEFNKSGVWVTDGNNPSSQTAIMNGSIAYTNDSWNTSRVALDSNSGLIAEALVGKLLIGDKLSIQDADTGNFFIGEGSKLSDDYKNKFGIFIMDNNKPKVFIGIEKISEVEYRSCYEFYSSNGKYAFSDKGLLQCDSKSDKGYVDKEHPLIGYFYVDEGIGYIDTCKLLFGVGALRSTVKSIRNESVVEGEITLETDIANGERIKLLQLHEGDTSTVETTTTASYDVLDKDGITTGYVMEIPLKSLNEPSGDIPQSIYANDKTKDHKHSFNIDLSHEHELEYGIFEDDVIASDINVYINNVLVEEKYNGTNEIDIKNYLKLGQWNEIKFTSETNGSIHWDMFLKAFYLF